MPAGSLLTSPPDLTARLRPRQNALLPRAGPKTGRIRSFGNMLSPVTLSAQERLTSELLRFL
jgi:hypothetical protein